MTSNNFAAWTPSGQFHLNFQGSLVLTIISEAWSYVCPSKPPTSFRSLPVQLWHKLLPCLAFPVFLEIFPPERAQLPWATSLTPHSFPPALVHQGKKIRQPPSHWLPAPSQHHVCLEPTNITALLLIMPCSIGSLSQLSQLESFASDTPPPPPPLTWLYLRLFCNTHSNLWSTIVCADFPFIIC